MSTDTITAALIDYEDDVRSVPTELAALGALMRLAALSQEFLQHDELMGASELLYLVENQARNAEKAFDLAFDRLQELRKSG